MTGMEYVLATLEIESKNAVEELEKAGAELDEASAATEKAWTHFMKSDEDGTQPAMDAYRACKSREEIARNLYHYRLGRKNGITELTRLIRPEVERALE